jgi:hypothetical protein
LIRDLLVINMRQMDLIVTGTESAGAAMHGFGQPSPSNMDAVVDYLHRSISPLYQKEMGDGRFPFVLRDAVPNHGSLAMTEVIFKWQSSGTQEN